MDKLHRLALLAAITGLLIDEELDLDNLQSQILVDANTVAWDEHNINFRDTSTAENFYQLAKMYEEKIKHEWK